MDRFVTVWNSFAGVAGFGTELKPVKKFQNRNIAVARIWKALQRLNGDATPEGSRCRSGQRRAHGRQACAIEAQVGEEGDPS
jgi:hypothetical protein